MTNEEAIKMLEYIRRTGNGESEYKNDAQAIAIDMAIKALEQMPCEDCCNGNQIEKAKLCQKSYIAGMEHKQKTGKWIDEADREYAHFGQHIYKCSECGKHAEYFVGGTEVWWDIYKPNFCPNCGARMVSE